MSTAGLWDDAVGRLRSVGLQWATWSVIGSFILYVLGYLTIRFHLTALGAGTDLGIVDERYLFAGARFAVYLVSACVTLLLLLLLPAALWGLACWLLSRRRKPGDETPGPRLAALRAWCLDQKRILIFGIVLAILFIQLVMKKCFFFGNLLLAQNLPEEPVWLSALVIGKDDVPLALFFAGLVASVAVSGGLLMLAGRAPGGDPAARGLFWLLAFLVAVQILLLPINFGTLIADKVLPRVASLDGVTPLRPGEEAWLVWEGTGMTYFVRRTAGDGAPRSLVTLNRNDVKRIEILGYDRILTKLFGGT